MFNKKIKKIIFLAIAIFLLAQPLVALAEIKLELNYPNLPGISDLTQSTRSLPMALRYYAQLGVIIAILVCIVSLVWAGVSYISSTGQPGAMKQARERIFNTFIGLAILIGSFIILKTISPQMSLLSITKPSVPTGGIVLLSKDGYNQFKDGKGLGDLIELGLVKPISGGIADFSIELGGDIAQQNYVDSLGNPDPENNYPNFRFYAIGFWGEASQLYEVTLFKDTQFAPQQATPSVLGADPVKFTYEGRVIDDKQVSNTDPANYFKGEEVGLEDKIKIFVINGHRSGTSGTGDRNQAIWSSSNDHPPQSIQIKNLKVGAFTVDAKNSETSASGDNPDEVFEGATAVKVINKVTLPNGTVLTGDGLYIASDDTQSEGNKAIYFQYRTVAQLKDVIPKIYFSNTVFQKQSETVDFTKILNVVGDVISNTDLVDDPMGTKYLKSFKFVFFQENEYSPNIDFVTRVYGRKDIGTDKAVEFGRCIEGKATATCLDATEYGYEGIYGNILRSGALKGKSSSLKDVNTYEIDSLLDVCREVTVCKKNGHCLKFVPADKTITIDKTYTHYLPMPFFRPVNLPKIKSWHIGATGIAEEFEDEFNDQVVSVETKGKCLVVLFEYPIKFAGSSNNKTFKGFDTGIAGIFLSGDKSIIVPGTTGGSASVDLGKTKAMKCMTITDRLFVLGFGGKDPCASSIVVFPIK